MVTVRHILVKVAEDAAESEKEAARKKAEDILAMVNSGEDFASLVKEFSEDPGSIDTGGEYTFTRDGNYVQEFKDWSFRHEPGDTGIVETVHGFHVMELLEKKTEFEEVADIAEAQLKNKIFSDMLEEWKSMPEYRLVKNEKVYNSIS
jgi:foldase protein PrsA